MKILSFSSRSTCLLFFLLSFQIMILQATHNRAGEILYKRIPPFSKVVGGVTVPVYNYSITVIKYTDHNFDDVADRCEDTVNFGDSERGIAPRINSGVVGCNCGPAIGCGELISNSPSHMVKKNIYSITHVYPGPGQYLIRSFDPNRNDGIANIPNSVNLPFYLESLVVINGWGRPEDESPVLTRPPVDLASNGQCFTHEPGAYDADLDSLSFEITTPRGVNGSSVPGYFYPPGNFAINAVTGELTWCSPDQTGEWAVAFIVKQWRQEYCGGPYYLKGYVLRDMQIIVQTNPATVTSTLQGTTYACVNAGDVVTRTISVGSSSLSVTAGVYGSAVDPSRGPHPVISSTGTGAVVSWATSCDHVQRQAHRVIVATTHSGLSKSSYNAFTVQVLPPPPVMEPVIVNTSEVILRWKRTCHQAERYNIYRKFGSQSVTTASCTQGNPANSGYSWIGAVDGADSTFTDHDLWTTTNGTQGNYFVTAVVNCAESAAMNIVTTTLVVGVSENSLDADALQAFPNPFSGSFTVKASQQGLLHEGTMCLFSVDGRLVLSSRLSAKESMEVDTRTLEKGLYIVEITTSEGQWRRTLLKE